MEIQVIDIISGMITGAPNFIGFIVLAVVMWKINSRQSDIIEMLVNDCLEDEQ